MKLPKVVALLIISLSMFMTGCNTSSESPESLIGESIVYDQGKNDLYTFVNKSLETKTLLLPKNSSEVGQINNVGSNIIVFQQEQDINYNSNKVGFVLIAKENDNYIVEDSILEEGDSIEYANFCDINKDGKQEVILLISNKSYVTMNIYSINNNEIDKISEVKPTWLKNYKKLNNMKIKICEISDTYESDLVKKENATVDILMINGESSGGDIYITNLNYNKNNEIKISNSVKIPDVKNLQDLYIDIGNIDDNQKGVILSIPTLKDNAYAKQLLYIKNDKIVKVFNDENMILNSYYIPVEDVNNDGVLEIPSLNNKLIANFTTSTKASSIVSWRAWNGKKGSNADTIFISQVYYNYKSNFKFLVPDNLANKLYVKKTLESNIPSFTFYYYDNDNGQNIELFQIIIVEKSLTEESKSSANVEALLAETYDNYYQLVISDKKSFEKYNLTVDTIKDYFSIIYK